MANSEWDAIRLGAKEAYKARQEIKKGNFLPFIPALGFAITKDGLLDVVSAIPVMGLPTQFLGLFISVFLFVFLFGKGTWKVRLVLFGLSLIDSIPILGLLPASTISVLYVWRQAKKKADQAKKALPVIQSNVQQIREYQMARARVAMEETKQLAQNEGVSQPNTQSKYVQAVDWVPLVGPAKMIGEAVDGKRIGGDRMSGSERVRHGAVGAGSLAADMTGAGEVYRLAKVGRAAYKLGQKQVVRDTTKQALKEGTKFYDRGQERSNMQRRYPSANDAQYNENKVRKVA